MQQTILGQKNYIVEFTRILDGDLKNTRFEVLDNEEDFEHLDGSITLCKQEFVDKIIQELNEYKYIRTITFNFTIFVEDVAGHIGFSNTYTQVH